MASFIPTIVFPLLLIGLSGLLVDAHRRTWQAAQWDERLNERDRRFARSQFRRRMQASGLIGVIGAVLGCYPLVPRRPLALSIYVAGIVAACCGMMLLAILDLWATRQNLRRIQSEQLADHHKLLRDLRSRSAAKSKKS